MPNIGYRNPKTARVEDPTVRDIAWAAGFYEGDGNASRTSTEIVTINQKDRWVLDRMRCLFGGHIGVRKNQGFNKGTHYVWRLSGARARGFFQSIYGLLSPRRQAQVRKVMYQ